MLSFIVACTMMIITPGPGVLSIAGVGSGFGFRASSRFFWGLFFGNAFVLLLVISGLSTLLFSVPYLREIFLFFSVSYLLFLAYRIATAGGKVGFSAASTAPTFGEGVILQLFNPKCYAVNTLLYTGFSIYPDNLYAEAIAKCSIWLVIWITLHFSWLWLGVSIRRMNLPEARQRQINIGMALSLVIVVVLAVLSQI